MPKLKLKLQDFIQMSKQHWGIWVVIAVSVWLRFWQLDQHLFFGFEQGRDARVVADSLTGKDFTLIGPKTDIAGIFHGPWYYYLLTIPYSLGRGNPLVASGFLVGLSMVVPVIAYIWGWQLTQSKRSAVLFGLLAGVSYELITYSRWLSNVTPAVPLLALSAWQLWQYTQTRKFSAWVVFVASFLLASTFEIILLLHFAWLLVGLVLCHIVKLTSWRLWVVVGIWGLVWHSPLLLFNLRNDWLFWRSLTTHTAGQESKLATWRELPSNGLAYAKSLGVIGRKAVWHLPQVESSGYALMGLVGLTLVAAYRSKQYRSTLGLLGLWLTMSVPVVFFRQVVGLPQLHVQAGFAWVMIVGVSLHALFGRWRWPQWGVLFCGVVVVLAGVSLDRLERNQDVFFKTIQDDLNLRDQLSLLDWIAADSAGLPYMFDAYTIPYFQSQGWLYLHQYRLGNPPDGTPVWLYVVVEEKVEEFWRKKWLSERGQLELVTTHQVGKLRVEKYQLPTSPSTP